MDDAENDGYDIGVFEDRPIWTTQGVETETFVSWRIDGWRFSREDPSLARDGTQELGRQTVEIL